MHTMPSGSRHGASMGPRLFSRGNMHGRYIWPRDVHASMGPRLFSRGNDNVIPEHARHQSSFNGATTFQPWKCRRVHDARMPDVTTLQWGHDFSAVEMSIDASESDVTDQLLQWGHDFSAVEMITFDMSWTHAQLASMGPRLFSRGNCASDCWLRPQYGMASMGPRLFSRGNGQHRAESVHDANVGFNGATTFQPWKCHDRCMRRIWQNALQWGHDFSAVEMH